MHTTLRTAFASGVSGPECDDDAELVSVVPAYMNISIIPTTNARLTLTFPLDRTKHTVHCPHLVALPSKKSQMYRTFRSVAIEDGGSVGDSLY